MSYYCFQSIAMRYGAWFSRSININTLTIREMLIHKTDFHRMEVQRAENGIQVISKEKYSKVLQYSHNCTYSYIIVAFCIGMHKKYSYDCFRLKRYYFSMMNEYIFKVMYIQLFSPLAKIFIYYKDRSQNIR